MRETLWLERPVLHSDGVHATIRHCSRAPNFVSRQTLLPDHQHILLLSSTCYALTHHRAEPRPIGCLPSPSHCTFQDGLLGGAVPIPSTPRGLRRGSSSTRQYPPDHSTLNDNLRPAADFPKPPLRPAEIDGPIASGRSSLSVRDFKCLKWNVFVSPPVPAPVCARIPKVGLGMPGTQPVRYLAVVDFFSDGVSSSPSS